jgi:acyl-CoA reductase-like NAD-dependent aldehyde dehydrogenase
MHHGQVSMSTERLIVVNDVAEEFTTCLRVAIETLNGDAGYAVTKAMTAKVQKLLSDTDKHGASFLMDNNSSRGPSGTAVEWTVVTNFKAGNPIADRETPGPSPTLYIVNDEDEAIALANSTPYCLTSAIHTKTSRRTSFSQRIGSRIVVLNGMTLWEESPVTVEGAKGCGWGWNNSRFGVEECLLQKTVAVRDLTEGAALGSGHCVHVCQ